MSHDSHEGHGGHNAHDHDGHDGHHGHGGPSKKDTFVANGIMGLSGGIVIVCGIGAAYMFNSCFGGGSNLPPQKIRPACERYGPPQIVPTPTTIRVGSQKVELHTSKGLMQITWPNGLVATYQMSGNPDESLTPPSRMEEGDTIKFVSKEVTQMEIRVYQCKK